MLGCSRNSLSERLSKFEIWKVSPITNSVNCQAFGNSRQATSGQIQQDAAKAGNFPLPQK
jgi:hypothetical protein